MADTSDFRNGLIMNMDGEYWTIQEFLHVKPGKGGAFVRTKIKKLLTGQVKEQTFRAGEKINEVLISEDEARNAIQFKECFIVQNNRKFREGLLNHLGKDKGQECPEGFKYTSDSNTEWMTIEDLKRLVEKIADDYSIEQSRWSMDDVPE